MTAQSPIADLNDTLLAWASSTEARLAGLLREVEVFVDLDISGDDVERLTTFYGTFLSRQIAAGGRRRRSSRRARRSPRRRSSPAPPG